VKLTAAPSTAPEEVSSDDEGSSNRDSAPMESTLGISVEPLSQQNVRIRTCSSHALRWWLVVRRYRPMAVL